VQNRHEERMKLQVDVDLVEQARAGDLAALDRLLRQLQRPVFNLALRMLGQREDAQDAAQEILIKVMTNLGTWREESAFTTWVWSVASHHLLNSATRSPRRREVSFEVLADSLDAGLAYAAQQHVVEGPLGPEAKLEARQTALTCTQAMLMCLDREQRLAYVLAVVFGLESAEAAQVQAISAAAHRQRVARARAAVHGFMQQRCGLVNERATCRCAAQTAAKRAARTKGNYSPGLVVTRQELDMAADGLRELVAMGNAAAVMRGAPEYTTPESLLSGIKEVLDSSHLLRR
jgi:RNA polymerase sigma factor (sigma-70 family)